MCDFFEKALMFAGGTLLVLATLLTVWWIVYVGSGAACSDRWEASGLNHRHSFIAGCFVEVSPGKWLASDKVRHNILKESLE